MASIVNIPFNFNPSTGPTRKTTSYTVPAGKYAKAVLSFYQPRAFSLSGTNVSQTQTLQFITINGSNVLSERTFALLLASNNGANSTASSTFNLSGFTGLMQGYLSGGPYQFGGMTGLGPTQPITPVGYANAFFNNSTVLSCQQAGATAFSGTITSFSVPEFLEVWLKAGDVISATGGNWQAIVTEYNAPS
jgi:hypothetical protein